MFFMISASTADVQIQIYYFKADLLFFLFFTVNDLKYLNGFFSRSHTRNLTREIQQNI